MDVYFVIIWVDYYFYNCNIISRESVEKIKALSQKKETLIIENQCGNQ